MLYAPHVRGVKTRVDSSFVALLIVDVRRVCDASVPVLINSRQQLLHEATDCDMVFVDGLET